MPSMRLCLMLIFFLFIDGTGCPGRAQEIVLKGKEAITAIFGSRDSSFTWIAYQDGLSKQKWLPDGPHFKIVTVDGDCISGTDCSFSCISQDSLQITLQAEIPTPPLIIKRSYSFCGDGRTLHITTALRSEKEPVIIQRINLMEISVPGEKLRLTGPEHVSFPVFAERIFAGVEHPSATCKVQGDNLLLYQSPYTEIGKEWVEFPAVVFGSASDKDFSVSGKEGLRKAFIRYLNSVRIKPLDMHIHYNDWWTAPQPSSEAFVLSNIEKLKNSLYDQTGFFFDSYALDEGWADRHSVWEINKKNFPKGFENIRKSLARIGSRPGLWVSPSSLYPNSLDNHWLEKEGYEVTPNNRLDFNACLAIGGRYQTAFKKVLEKHVRQSHLAHVKFDGFVPSCNEAAHGHPTGEASYQALAEGLIDVFQSLRKIDPMIALEPTCFGYQASPWWLLYVPFIIGPFGDDSPKGRCPSPQWIEAMTTARDIKNREGRKNFLMPGPALQCFDIVVQCPGAFQNHAVMAIGRGRWFISSYINPRYMDTAEWQFFAELVAWARANREFLQEPVPIGGDPANREAYGYAFFNSSKELYCLRNPWMVETSLPLPESSLISSPREIRTIYPRRHILGRRQANVPSPSVHLGPYETKFIEIVPIDRQRTDQNIEQVDKVPIPIHWYPRQKPFVETIFYESATEPFGPDWSCPDGDTEAIRRFKLEGELEIKGTETCDLYILCEGRTIKSAFPQIDLTINGLKGTYDVSRSVGSFFAGGYSEEDWAWFKVPLQSGKHYLRIEAKAVTPSAKFGVFLCGTVKAPPSPPAPGSGPAFPLFQPQSISWSQPLVKPSGNEVDSLLPRSVKRPIERINGIYLDTMEWISATAGWGEIHLNQTVKGQTMTMGGNLYHRGIGTHADSRIVYQCPGDARVFAATIGCDQKALVGSVVFVVEGDGRELFRSRILRADSRPVDIRVPLDNIQELALIVEDGGDRINADHGNWANARFLKK